MTIVTSGAISLGNAAGTNRSISGEFGGATPHSMSEYRRGGGLVPNGPPQNNNIPTTNSNISFSNFYGSINLATNLTNQTTFSRPVGTIRTAEFLFGTNGVLTRQVVQGASQVFQVVANQWIIGSPVSGIEGVFEIRFTITQEPGVFSSNVFPFENIWIPLDGSPASLQIRHRTQGSSQHGTGSITCQIRLSATQVILQTATLSFQTT